MVAETVFGQWAQRVPKKDANQSSIKLVGRTLLTGHMKNWIKRLTLFIVMVSHSMNS